MRERAAEILWRGTSRPRQPNNGTLARLDAAVTWIAQSELSTPRWARLTVAVAASVAIVAAGVGGWAMWQPHARSAARGGYAVTTGQARGADVTVSSATGGEWGFARAARRRTAAQRRRVAAPMLREQRPQPGALR